MNFPGFRQRTIQKIPIVSELKITAPSPRAPLIFADFQQRMKTFLALSLFHDSKVHRAICMEMSAVGFAKHVNAFRKRIGKIGRTPGELRNAGSGSVRYTIFARGNARSLETKYTQHIPKKKKKFSEVFEGKKSEIENFQISFGKFFILTLFVVLFKSMSPPRLIIIFPTFWQ